MGEGCEEYVRGWTRARRGERGAAGGRGLTPGGAQVLGFFKATSGQQTLELNQDHLIQHKKNTQGAFRVS